MNESTPEYDAAHANMVLSNSTLIGGMLIGVAVAWTAVYAKRYIQRKAIRINRRNKKEVALKS
jgi:hypothetical protein